MIYSSYDIIFPMVNIPHSSAYRTLKKKACSLAVSCYPDSLSAFGVLGGVLSEVEYATLGGVLSEVEYATITNDPFVAPPQPGPQPDAQNAQAHYANALKIYKGYSEGMAIVKNFLLQSIDPSIYALFEDPVHGLITVTAADIIQAMDARYLTMTAQEAESTKERLRDCFTREDNIRSFTARHRELHAILLYNNNAVNPRDKYTYLRNALSGSPLLSAEIAPFVRAFPDPNDQTFDRFVLVLINAVDNQIIRPGTMTFAAAKMDDLIYEDPAMLLAPAMTHNNKKTVRDTTNSKDPVSQQQMRLQKQYLCPSCGWKSIPHPICILNTKK
jgi:hypothetical protein